MFAVRRLLLVIIACCFVGACASGSGSVHPKANFSKVGRVAVVVNSEVLSQTQIKETSDLFSMKLLGKGFDVVDRANLDQLIKESKFQGMSGLTSDRGRAKLRLKNIKSLVVVNVASAGSEVSMTAKMTMLESGSLVWMGEGTGDANKTLAAAGGAILGAIAGNVVSNKTKTSSIFGTVAGGAAGGVAGAALTPSQAKLMRMVIDKTTESLPSLVQPK